eukprot:11766668-Ditylum_brightwellii.AAC.1
MTTTNNVLKQLCIKYEAAFQYSDMEKAKLFQTYVDRSARALQQFEEVVTDTAEEKWESIVFGIEPGDLDVNRFDQTVKEFYQKYYDAEAKDTMFEYLCALRQSTKAQPRDHSNRVETLVRYANKLPGLHLAMTNEQVKKLVFDQHSEKWRIAYNCSGRAVETDTLAAIVQFMSDKKGYADREEDRRKTKGNGHNNR